MTKKIEENLAKIPIVNILVRLLRAIPIPGFKGLTLYDIIEMYILGIVKGALTSRAGGIAFSFFMALFPFLLFILTLIPFVPIDGFQKEFIDLIEQLLPPNTAEAVNDVLSDIANNKYGGLLSFGFVTSMFLMTNCVNAIFGGFEYSYHVTEVRNVVKQYLIAFGVSLMLCFFLLFAVAITVFFEVIVQKVEVFQWLREHHLMDYVGRLFFFILIVYVTVSVLYRFGTKEVSTISFFSPGSIFTTILTILMFYLFSIYVVRFSKYNELYGSIGTLLVIMLFIWLNSIILLLGFELNASINRLKKKHYKKKDQI